MRAEIERRLRHRCDRHLRPVRSDRPRRGQECVETKDGPTIWEDHFYPEVIDPETGAVLPDGEKGELVFTSLTKEALPIIRYRTRDLTRLLPGTARPGMRRMAKITGRTDDMMIMRGVNVFPTQIEEALLRDRLVRRPLHHRADAGRPHGRDDRARRSPARKLGRQRVARAHRESLGLHQEYHRHHRRIKAVAPDTLERSPAAKRVYDKRPKQFPWWGPAPTCPALRQAGLAILQLAAVL